MTDVSVCDDIDAQAGVEFYSGILVPDLINAHCHLELSYLKGRIAPGGGFTRFAKAMGEVRGGVSASERAEAAESADRTLWYRGIGAVGDICNGATTFALKARSRIKYINFLELFGLNSSSAAALSSLEAEAAALGLPAAVTPHSTYSLNDGAFRAAVEANAGKVPLSIHFMESPAEKELFEGRGELSEWYAERGTPIDFGGYGSPAKRIVACVPPQRDILLIHNCYVCEEDVEIIESHFTGRVTWVLCPKSNEYISGVYPPVELLRRKGVRIAVGTDSLASNDSLDLIAELRKFRGVPLEELLSWATVNGVKALGLEREFGLFEPGRKSGVVLISGIDWESMSLTEQSRAERIL